MFEIKKMTGKRWRSGRF